MKLPKVVALLGVLASSAVMGKAPQLPENIDFFAFGSCAKERKEQPIWNAILDSNPQMFLFIGDNHYGDYWAPDGWTLQSAPVTKPERIREAYDQLGAKPGYAKLRETMPVFATWDDHDYGANDAGKHFPLKKESQQAFLDFFGYEAEHPLRSQEGIYHSQITGKDGQRTQFIFLDTRYHRDDLQKNMNRQKGEGPYVASNNKQASMLGEAQWQWLEEQLRQPADIRFIISSIQVVAYEHGWESWGTLPHERQRLFDLIAETYAQGVVFLSGDRHLTEVSVEQGDETVKVPYPIWDFTASGMTDGWDKVGDYNRFRKGDAYRGSHFGTIKVNWAEQPENTTIAFTALTDEGKLIHRHQVALSELTFPSTGATKKW